ncbi:MAG: DUF6516 family protein [Thermodesulfobacteriota bacterium]
MARWDSAPHHKELSSFPFHIHKKEGIQEHQGINLIEALEEISQKIIFLR